MTPKEFDSKPEVKALFRKKDFLKASLMAKTVGNLTKDGKMRKHSQKLLAIHRRLQEK